jgi:hypothetical protein
MAWWSPTTSIPTSSATLTSAEPSYAPSATTSKARLAAAQQQGQDIRNPALLDHLPVTDINLEGVPDDISRRLFEALRLEIRYDPAARTARCSITLAGETIDAVSRVAQEATARGSSRCDTRPTGRASDMRDGLRSAPSGAPRKPSSAQHPASGVGRLR